MDEFRKILSKFGELSAWASAGAATSFIALFLGVAPPWPTGAAGITAVIQLVALILAFQLLRRARRRTVNRVLVASVVLLAILSMLYLTTFSLLTFETPRHHYVRAKGLVCTPEAKILYADICPWLDADQLIRAEWEARRLWTLQSITAVRVGLLTVWAAAFATLTTAIGAFLVSNSEKRLNGRGHS